MTQLTKPIRDIRAEAQQVAHRATLHASPAIAFLARAGYAAKGVVYVMVGSLALLAAAGWRQGTTGSKGALHTLIDEPFGRVMLSVIAAGLVGYVLWCFVRAILDPEHDGNDAKGLAKRAVQFGKGLIHAALVVAVVRMVLGTRGNDGEQGVRDWTAWLMSFPLGIWMVGLTGAGIICYGVRQIYRAWTVDLDDQLDLSRLRPAARQWTLRFSRFGMAARGAVFGIIGVFLLLAAYQSDPGAAKGVGGTLQSIERQSYGAFIEAAVGLGLVAYGAFELIRSRYRRIEPT